MTEHTGEPLPDWQDRPRWRHLQGDEYQPVFGDFVGDPRSGYTKEWWALTGQWFPTRIEAEKAGLSAQGSDDFNIVVRRAGRVVALLWMTEDIGEDESVLASIAAHIGGTRS